MYLLLEERVGFIGLGQMGAPMAQNLVKAGFDVMVYDEQASKSNGFPRYASSLTELSKSCHRIITMLPSNEIVDEVFQKIALELPPNSSKIIVDCSTVAPGIAQKACERLRERGVSFFDAPVSGGVKGAQAASLTFLVGDSSNQVESIRDLLLAMGQRIFVCGPVGSGQVAKICNNLILGVSMIALSEALNLGRQCGLDPKVLSQVINASSGRSWASEGYNPVPGVMKGTPADAGYRNGFASKLLVKDLGLAREEAHRVEAQIPATEMAYQLYQRMLQNEKDAAGKDFSSIYEYITTLKT